MQPLHNKFLAKFVFIAALALGSSPAFSQVSLSVDIAPPPLQVDTQPECPGDGYLWTPGYWAYDNAAYYWVPGAWVQPPEIGMLWTPPYWGWGGNAYAFHAGSWGSQVGYYGGINYGYGYGGSGYGGGRWEGSHFSYNTAVNNVRSIHVQSTYSDRTVIKAHASRVSYDGGKHGAPAQSTAQNPQASNSERSQPVSAAQVTSEKSSADGSSERQIKAPTQTSQMSPNTHVDESHTKPARPETHTQPETHAQPQTHAEPQARIQPQAGPDKPQNH